MIPKELAQVGPGDIQALIDGKVIEGKTLEFKRDLAISRDADKREFLADASSFANTLGGDLVIGVECKDGLPVAAPGMAVDNADQLLQQINNLIRDGLEPRMPALDAAFIPVSDNRQVLVLRIRQSWAAPHRVVFLKDRGFYARTSSGKYGLDVQELRAAFTQGPALAEQLRRFREQRLGWVTSGQGTLTMAPGALAILHVVPVDGFLGSRGVDLTGRNPASRIMPMEARGWTSRRNLDGILRYTGGAGQPTWNYAQVFSNGTCEYVSGLGDGPISGQTLQDELIGAIDRTILFLVENDLAGRIVVFLSFHGVKGTEMSSGSRWYSRPSMGADRDSLVLPELMLEGDEGESPARLRQLLDSMWQAFGYDQCPSL